MGGAFNKEIVRSITRSAGRFAAIAIISLLGAGVYAGLRCAAPDMRIAGDEFFDATNFHDASVVCTLGLDDESLATLSDVEGVGGVMAAHRADAMVLADAGGYAARIESFPVSAARQSDTSDGVHAVSDDEGYLNRLILEEGNWPSSETDCVVGVDAARELGINVGDKLQIVESKADKASEEDDAERGDPDNSAADADKSANDDDADDEDEPTFARTDLTVAGLVNSPSYCSSSMLGTTSLGTGELELYLYVPDEVFDADLPYSVAYATVPSARGELWDTPPYDQAVDQVKQRIEDVAPAIGEARYRAVVDEAQAELDDARADYLKERADAEDELADAKKELDDGKAELDDAENELANARADISSGRDELAKARKKLDDARSQLNDAHKQLDDNRKKLDDAQAQLQQTYELITQTKQGIDAGAVTGPQAIAQYNYMVSEYEKGLAEYNKGLAAYNEGLKKYEAGVAEYEKGKKAYEQGVKEYNDGLKKYNDGAAKYADGVAEYNDGLAEYEDGVAEANQKFADAEDELADAQNKIDDIEHPQVYVLDRSKNAGAASLSSDADGITQIALFLPYMFFLVAALVSLTSMTRMVEEERLIIGTHKALGYNKGRITSKYLIYGALASGIGSTVGVVMLGKLLPWFILVSYGISYAVPVYPTPIDPGIAIYAIGLSVSITLLATWWAAASTLRETPAALMLPRVPKAGKRIVLENIGPLWSRMSFSHKVTARNLLRYKRRFFMAVIGVAGCTALLMVGFGLRDAIGGIVSNQYQELVSYDAIVRIDEDAEDAQRDQAVKALVSDDIESYLMIADHSLIAEPSGTNTSRANDDASDVHIELVVPSDPARLSDFVTLRDRQSQEPIALRADGIVLTEKAADVLGVKVGDTVILYDQNDVGDKDGDGHSFTVTGIAENYLGHFAFALPERYQSGFGDDPSYDVAYTKVSEGANPSALSERLLALDGVSTVCFVADKILTYEGMLDVMNKLIYVIMLLSAALAFVVLYNLTNINITERVREIATLKVLGFTKGEVGAYIFREIMVMSLIGALIGCALGVPLTFYIARAAETADMMFGRTIEPASFALSFGLTIAFAVIVAFTMRGKLARVNMVESLKSVE